MPVRRQRPRSAASRGPQASVSAFWGPERENWIKSRLLDVLEPAVRSRGTLPLAPLDRAGLREERPAADEQVPIAEEHHLPAVALAVKAQLTGPGDVIVADGPERFRR